MADTGETVEVVLTGMTGEQLTTLRVEPKTTVSMVKDMVQNDFGYPPSSQQLLLQDQIVEDNDLLVETLPHPILFSLVLLPFDKTKALHKSVEDGREAAVRNLLFSVASDSDETSALLLTHPLNRAAELGHEAMCQVLLAAAPDQLVKRQMVLGKRQSGHMELTALHFAVQAGHERACRALFQCGLDVETQKAMVLEKDDLMAFSALGWACYFERETVVRALLESAPSVEVQVAMLQATDMSGQTVMEAFDTAPMKELAASLGL